MRARLAIVIAIGTLGLVVATEALADSPSTFPPAQISPADGSPFTSPANGIVFQASVPVAMPIPPSQMDFYISQDPPVLDSSTGVMSNSINVLHGGPTGDVTGDGSPIYAASPNPNEGWPSRPGTYYWQAVYVDCIQSTDCFNQSPDPPLSFIINPRPASTVGLGSEPKTFLEKHPRHRTHKRKVKFAFSSDVAGAHFQCLYAQGWAACKSPHTFRHLKPGRFRFQARAVVNGVEDPTPASWTFKVLR